ncbi:MAG TPA: peptidoglycan-binding domain-containing protein [Chthoniobacterales bacterium]|nr:peptidoglycan-binding domain-containing protein [Chthoniobacterales bacterium]
MNFRRLLPVIAAVTIAGAMPTAQAGYRYYYPYRHHYHSYTNVSIGFGVGYPYGGWGYGWPYSSYGYYPYGYGYGYGYYPSAYSYYPSTYGYYPYSYGYYSRPTYRGQSVNSNVVVRVQERLARSGYYHGAIDGVAGPATRQAIRAYERTHGLRVDGVVSNQLLATMGLRY